MTVTALIFAPQTQPFLFAFLLMAGFAALEAVLLAAGAGGAGGGDADAGLDAGADPAAELEAAVGEAGEPEVAGAGPLAWLGLGRTPFLIWAAAQLAAFASLGWVLQVLANAALGRPLSAWLAAPLVLLPALRIGGGLAGGIGRALPQIETTAVSRARLGGRRAVVTVGEARRGFAAEARVRDHHGRTHYVRVEPFDDDGRLRAGEEIALLSTRRLRPEMKGVYLGVPLDAAEDALRRLGAS